MKFEFITMIEGFSFYEFYNENINYRELWIMNKETTQMKFIFGSMTKIEEEEVKRLYAKNYFDNWLYDEEFTDQED